MSITKYSPEDIDRLAGRLWQLEQDLKSLKMESKVRYSDSVFQDKQNLIVKNNAVSPLSKMDINVDYLQVQTSSLTNIDLTVDITVNGINGLDTGDEAIDTWYSIWVIYDYINDLTKGLLSKSLDSPTLPAGYTKKRRVGWIRNNADGNFMLIYQYGSWWIYDTWTILFYTADPVKTPNWGDVDCSDYAPPTTRLLLLWMWVLDTNFCHAGMALRRKGATGTVGTAMVEAGGSTGGRLSVDRLSPCNEDQMVQYQINVSAEEAQLNIFGYYDEY